MLDYCYQKWHCGPAKDQSQSETLSWIIHSLLCCCYSSAVKLMPFKQQEYIWIGHQTRRHTFHSRFEQKSRQPAPFKKNFNISASVITSCYRPSKHNHCSLANSADQWKITTHAEFFIMTSNFKLINATNGVFVLSHKMKWFKLFSFSFHGSLTAEEEPLAGTNEL